MAVKMEVMIMHCSLNSVHIFLANEMSLSNTLVIISLIPIIWLVSLPLKRLMLSFLTFRSSLSLLVLFLMPSRIPSQVQHGMGSLINMQKSVFLPLWDYELYGRKILHIERFSAIESENLVRISKFFIWKEYACTASKNDKKKKHNILQLSEAVGILHVLSTSPDLSKINWALSIFSLSGKIYVINFFSFAKLA